MMSDERNNKKLKRQDDGVHVTPTGRIGYTDSRDGNRQYHQPDVVKAFKKLRDDKEDEIGANKARAVWQRRRRMLGISLRLEMVRTTNQIRRAFKKG